MSTVRLFRRRPRREPMPPKFGVLARYNTERAYGIMHVPEYDERMARLQAEFDEWQRQSRG